MCKGDSAVLAAPLSRIFNPYTDIYIRSFIRRTTFPIFNSESAQRIFTKLLAIVYLYIVSLYSKNQIFILKTNCFI